MLELKVHDGKREVVLLFEHSLLAVSKWESEFKKVFLSRTGLSDEEMLNYFECMLVSPNVDPRIIYRLPPEGLLELQEYIHDPHTASSVPSSKGGGSTEPMTSELIYYWMTMLKINWDAQNWHLGRLMMLIQIASYKQQPASAKSTKALQERWSEANERQTALLTVKKAEGS